jgi:hypothetical protein
MIIMVYVSICKYNDLNFAGDSICIMDPSDLSKEDVEFRAYIVENINKTPGKKAYWLGYFKGVMICKKSCKYLDRAGLTDKTKLVAWIPDELDENTKDKMELIPDSSIGSKCKCFINKDKTPEVNEYLLQIIKI